MVGKIGAFVFLAILFALLTPGVSSLQQDKNVAQREQLAVRLVTELVLVPVQAFSKRTWLPVDGLKREFHCV